MKLVEVIKYVDESGIEFDIESIEYDAFKKFHVTVPQEVFNSKEISFEWGGLLMNDPRFAIYEISGVYVKNGYLNIKGYIR
ncbi:hypothetical protein C1N66_30680 [Bacillus cereus]|uniref:Phage protein n=1 Tax=Bacillus cereus TaxID=1396 RepID=A0AB73USH1_BACCE|nr:hypothetical protein [Bacillus cereus]QHV03795.1 hypothetical protein C1N82_10950 [Bacillus cereus]QHV47247.1 hypothetical protein C1N66_30680 [Bacillus cereus]